MNDTTPPIPEISGVDPAEDGTPEELSAPLTPSRTLALLLKHPAHLFEAIHRGSRLRVNGCLLAITVACFLAYGGIVGLFSGATQLWAAPLKVAGGALFSGLICLPSLYIFSCLSGIDRGIAEITGLLLAMLCLASVLLVGFAPVAWVFSASTESIGFMGFLHLAFWGVGVFFGIRLLLQGVAQFHVDRHGYLHLWVMVFMVVSLQMTSTLRPIVGSSESFFSSEKMFFLQHWSEQLFSGKQASGEG